MNKLIIAIGLLLLTAFQNCSPIGRGVNPQFKGQAQDEFVPHNSGSGVGYDGKTYQKVADKACKDGSNVLTKITRSQDVYTLFRENCQDVAPRVLGSAEVTPDPVNTEVIVYSNQFLMTSAYTNPSQIQVYCLASSASASVSISGSTAQVMTISQTYNFNITAQGSNYTGLNASGDQLSLFLNGSNSTLTIDFAGPQADINSPANCL